MSAGAVDIGLEIEVLDDLDLRSVPAGTWARLLAQTPRPVPFVTGEWQRAWWKSFGRGRLIPILVRREGTPVLLAPLFADGGMIFLVGSGGSDYLDLVGPPPQPGVLARVLEVAREHAPGFVGFRFYHLPDASATGDRLSAAARLLGMECVEENSQVAPVLDLRPDPDAALRAAGKKSLRRHERYFAREGELRVRHLAEAAAIEPLLDAFFEQHVARWADTPYPSLFLDPAQRRFYRALVREAGPAGWLRFTCIEWNGDPIAFHLGFFFQGSFLWYKPSFAIALSRRSPGEVLLRHLILEAAREHAHTFDFGLGEEAFKRRFATSSRPVRDIGIYPRGVSGSGGDCK